MTFCMDFSEMYYLINIVYISMWELVTLQLTNPSIHFWTPQICSNLYDAPETILYSWEATVKKTDRIFFTWCYCILLKIGNIILISITILILLYNMMLYQVVRFWLLIIFSN